MNTSEKTDKQPLSPIMTFLRGEKWALFVFVAITIPLMVHTSHLIVKVSGLKFGLFPGDDIIYSAFFAIGFDLAILTLAVRGKMKDFNVVTFLIFLFNAFFLNWDFINSLPVDMTIPAVAMVFIRLTIAGTATWLVHAYVSFFVSSAQDEDKTWALYKTIEQLKAQLEVTKMEFAPERERLSLLNEENIKIKAILELMKQDKLDQFKIATELTNTISTIAGKSNEVDIDIDEPVINLRCVCGKKNFKTDRALQKHLQDCSMANSMGMDSLEAINQYFQDSPQTDQGLKVSIG